MGSPKSCAKPCAASCAGLVRGSGGSVSFGAATKELKSRSEARAKRCRLEQLRVQGLVRTRPNSFPESLVRTRPLNKTFFPSRAGMSLVRTRPQFSQPTQKSCSTLFEPCSFLFVTICFPVQYSSNCKHILYLFFTIGFCGDVVFLRTGSEMGGAKLSLHAGQGVQP